MCIHISIYIHARDIQQHIHTASFLIGTTRERLKVGRFSREYYSRAQVILLHTGGLGNCVAVVYGCNCSGGKKIRERTSELLLYILWITVLVRGAGLRFRSGTIGEGSRSIV